MYASLVLLLAAVGQAPAANVGPQIGYVYPPSVHTGGTVEVRLGTYDWTPDMQIVPHDPRIKIEVTGPASEPILTPPPFWFGQRGGIAQPPHPREVPAKITIPAGYPAGPVRWQAANANGGTNLGTILVGDHPPVIEPEGQDGPLDLPPAPAKVCGRLAKISEVDSYRFKTPKAGLVTCRVEDRLGQPFHSLLKIHDAAGKLVADCANTTGESAVVRFVAAAGATYTASLCDVDFSGDRGYVYCLSIEAGPQIVATRPLVIRRGAATAVEFVGWGLTSNSAQLESATQSVNIPADASGDTFVATIDTPAGRASAKLVLGETSDMLEPRTLDAAARQLTASSSVAGTLELLEKGRNVATDRYQITTKKGEPLRLLVEAERFGSPIDPSLAIVAADGKELARNDDLPGTTDAGLDFKPPADGVYDVVISDFSGLASTAASVYRLSVEKQTDANDFSLQLPDRIDIPVAGKSDLVVKVTRQRAWKEPITVTLSGLPEGVTAPAELSIPAAAKDFKISLTAADDAATTAALASLVAKVTIGDRTIERRAGPVLVTTTLKTRCVVKSAVQDGGRIVNRGTTYPADVIVERLEGYEGPVILQMGAVQQRQRRGILGHTVTVPPGVDRAQFPIFMPEWLETSLTCRMNVVGVVQVADPRGNVRHVIGNMDGFVVMSVEGGLLKASHEPAERIGSLGGTIEIPIRVSRSLRLPVGARVELASVDRPGAEITADAVELSAGDTTAVMKVRIGNEANLLGTRRITFRATALQDGRWPVVSETTVPIEIERNSN